MSKEANLAALTKFAEAVNTGNYLLFKEVVASDSVDHDPVPGQVSGPDGYQMFFSRMRTAFPDLNVALEALVANEDSVAIAYTLTGTQQGMFGKLPATGKTMKIRGVQLSKFRNGLMVERWGSSDELGLLAQLGATEPECGQ